MRPALRLLPLPFCIAMSLAAQAAEERPDEWKLCPISDAVPAFPDAQAPVGKPQARVQLPTDIEGDQFTGTDQNPQFHGNVTLRRGDQFLGADNLDYTSDTGRYVAEGSVRYQDSGMRLVADRAEGDQNTDSHNLQDVHYQLMSRRGNGGAEHIEMHGSQGALYGATYSTCPPDDRKWELRAQRIDVDTDAGTGVARDAVLHVGSVPVLYVPWFPFPIDDRRRTGLLYPSIGSSGRNGFDWRQPYYLNLAPNYDATLTPRLMTARGLQIGAQFRYLTETGRGVFDTAWMPNDKLRDEDRGMFRFRGSQDLGDEWQLRGDINWVSDTRYLEDFNNNLYGLAANYLTSTVGLFGQGRYWEAGLSADHKLLTDHLLSERILPFDRMPRAFLSWEQPFGRWFSAGLDTEAVRFDHDTRPGGERFDFKPHLSMPLQGASWFVTPTLAWRYTGYRLSDELAANVATTRATQYARDNDLLTGLTGPQRRALLAGLAPQFYNDRPSRNLPIGSLDAGLYFDRETTLGGESYLQTLEPRLFYLRVPYEDQSDLPLFDTRPLTFSWGQLFRDNRYTGADRQTDANQLTLALTSHLIRQSDGREKLTASIGQIRYFDDSRVLAPSETPVERGQSAWVTDLSYVVNDRWSVGASYQWDPKFRRQDLASARARYLVGDDGIVNLSYRYRRNLLEQADVSFLYPLNPTWSLIGRYYYSFYRSPTQQPGLLEGIAGVQWDSCCVAVRVVARRYIHNREGELANALQFEVELKGLGSVGADTRRRLRRAILGYDREDLYLVPPSEVTDTGDDSDVDDANSPDFLP